jgi:hypothetical protein
LFIKIIYDIMIKSPAKHEGIWRSGDTIACILELALYGVVIEQEAGWAPCQSEWFGLEKNLWPCMK